MDVGKLKYTLEVDDQGSAKTIEQASKSVKSLKDEVEDADKKGKKFKGSMFAMNSEALNLSNSALKVAGAMAAAGAALGGVALKQAADFEQSMANVSTLMDQETLPLLEDMKTDLLAIETPTSIDELAEGLFFIKSAGIEASESIQALTDANKLAVAGNTDTATSIKAIVGFTKAYGEESVSTAFASDLLFTINKKGFTTFEEVASSINKSTSAASLAGVSQVELAATMATLVGATGNASEVTTQMNGIYKSLVDPSTELQKALEGIGFSTGTAAVETLGFQGALDAVFESTGKSTNEFSKLFSEMEAKKAVIPLVTTLSGDLSSNLNEAANAAGATEEAFAKATDTFQASSDILKNRFNSILIEAGTEALPKLTEEFDNLNDILDENSEAISNIISGMAGFAASIAGTILEKIINFATFLSENKIAAAGFAGAIVGLMVPALKTLAFSAGKALLPLLPYIATFAAVAAAGTFLYDNFDSISGFMEDKFPKAFALGSEIVGDFKQAFDDISESMKTSLEKVEEKSLVASNETVANLVEMSQESQKAILEMKLTGEGLSGEMREQIVNNSFEMRDQVINSIDGMVEGQIGALEEMKNLGIITQETFDEAAEKNLEFAEQEKVLAEERAERIKEITELLDAENQAVIQDKIALNDELERLTQEDFNSALAVTDAKVSEILELQNLLKVESGRIAAEQAAELAQEAVTAKDEAIALADEEYREQVAILTKQKDELGILNEEQYNDAITNAQEIRDGLVEEAELAAEEVVSATEEMAEEQGLVFDRSTNTILTDWEVFWRDLWDTVVEWFSYIGNSIKGFFVVSIPAMYNGAADMVSRFWEAIKALPGDVKDWAIDVMDKIIQGIKDGINGVFEASKEIATKVIDAVKDLPGQMLDAATDAVNGFINGITFGLLGVEQAAAKIGSAATKGVNKNLRIQSPSKVFQELGGFTAEGFLLGIEDGTPAVIDSMNSLTEGLIAEAEEMEEKLDFGKAFEELEEVVDDAYDAAEDAVLDFVKENQAAQEDIRSEIEKTENDISKLTQSFENAAEASKLKFEDKATGIVLGAEDKSSDIQNDINEKNEEALQILERINEATAKGEEGTRELEKAQADQIKNQEKLLELQADLAEQQLILQTAEENGVVTAEQLEEARRVASLNPLEALIEQYEAEKLAREEAFNEELLQLEERKVALEDSLALRQEEYENFILTLSDEDVKFTQSVTNELKKRETATTDSINRLITLYNKLAAAKKSAGRKEGGFAEGSDVGFSEGGATGIGHDNEVAGDVHKNEYVVPAWQVRGMPNVIKSLEAVRTKQVPMGDTVNNNQRNFSVNQVINNDVDAVAAFNRLKWMM